MNGSFLDARRVATASGRCYGERQTMGIKPDCALRSLVPTMAIRIQPKPL